MRVLMRLMTVYHSTSTTPWRMPWAFTAHTTLVLRVLCCVMLCRRRQRRCCRRSSRCCCRALPPTTWTPRRRALIDATLASFTLPDLTLPHQATLASLTLPDLPSPGHTSLPAFVHRPASQAPTLAQGPGRPGDAPATERRREPNPRPQPHHTHTESVAASPTRAPHASIDEPH